MIHLKQHGGQNGQICSQSNASEAEESLKNRVWIICFQIVHKTAKVVERAEKMWKVSDGGGDRVGVHAIARAGGLNHQGGIMKNFNELIYMIRMNDETALKELIGCLKGTIEYGITSVSERNVSLWSYREDLRIEALVSLMKAIETYQDDLNCSFGTYAAVVLKNRIKQQAGRMIKNNSYMMLNTESLDVCNEEMPGMSNLLASKDMMSVPEYRMRFNEAYDRYLAARDTMSVREKEVCDAWIEGGTYVMESGKLGMSIRQYEHQLRRVRNKVKEAVADENK